MFEVIKKSLVITKDNPILTLGFVIYFIILSLVLKKLAVLQASALIMIALFAVILLNACFFAGWFQMVKFSIKNSKKHYESEEEKFLDIINLRKDFFEAIPSYILSVISIIVLYYLLFTLWIYLNIHIAEKFIGKIDFLLADMKNLTQTNELALEYLKSLPNEKLNILYGWQMLFTVSIGLFSALTIFWPAALYYGRNKNPFLAFWNSITAVFRKPLGVIGLNIFIAFLIMILMPLGGIASLNPITSFIYLVLSIYFFVFLVVLIFNYYAENLIPSNHRHNRSHSIGEEQAGN